MIIIAGFLAGSIMALIFVAHLSIMFVYNPPGFVRDSDQEHNNVLRVVLMMHGLALLVWPVVGIVTAVLNWVVREDVSNVVFGLGVLLVELLMAPVLVLLTKGRWLHLTAQFVVFFIIFAVVIPALVSRVS